MSGVCVDPLFHSENYHGPHADHAYRVGKRYGHRWSHLFANTRIPGAVEEMHLLAAKLGLRRDWFDEDHYDLTPSKRQAAIDLGAIPVGPEEAVAIWGHK